MDFEKKWRRLELEEQIRLDKGWDEYDSNSYGWERSTICVPKRHYYFEIGSEFSVTSIPHKIRRFGKD